MPLSFTAKTTSFALALGRRAGSGRRGRCTWPRCSAGWRGPGPAASGRPSGMTGSSGRSTCSSCSGLVMSGRPLSTAVGTTLADVDRSSLRSSSLPRDDAGDVEQVVDQADQLLDLPLDHGRGSPRRSRGRRPRSRMISQRVADRRQRVAQLVGQGREELVLAAVGRADASSARMRSATSASRASFVRASRRSARGRGARVRRRAASPAGCSGSTARGAGRRGAFFEEVGGAGLHRPEVDGALALAGQQDHRRGAAAGDGALRSRSRPSGRPSR